MTRSEPDPRNRNSRARAASRLARKGFGWVAPPLLVFGAVLAAFAILNGSASSEDAGADASARAAAGLSSTEELVTELEAAAPGNPNGYTALGDAYYQRARETGDQAFVDQAADAYEIALSRDPGDTGALAGQATLALTRHDFRGGLELALQAREADPRSQAPYAPLVDAQIELGRYRAAVRSIERLIGLKPNLTAYTRVSYFRELQGDLPGALDAMRHAVSAGSASPENAAFTRSLLGKLQADLGNYGAAKRSYVEALAIDPPNRSAAAGLAAIEAGSGNYESAIRRYRALVSKTGLPAHGYALAQAEEAAGRSAAAKRDYARAARLSEPGVDTRSEAAVFEADHGDPAEAVRLARGGWEAAPSVSSADSLAWALLADGKLAAAQRFSREAMKLGSRDPSFLFHAGMIAAAAGEADRAQRLLSRLLEQSPRFDPLGAQAAGRTLDQLAS